MELLAEDLLKVYRRRPVVDHLSFELKPGVTGLLGRNGAGKSTLLKMLATVLPPTGGQIRYSPLESPRDLSAIRHRLGYLPQLFGLYDHQTGHEFLTYACALKGVAPWRAARDEAARLMEVVGLNPGLPTRLGRYSGGMRQRVGLAQSLINQPELLILDEPSAGLDPEERTRILSLVSLLAGKGRLLLSTHVVADLEQLADHVLILHEGRLTASGSPAEIAGRAAGRVHLLTMPVGLWAQMAPAWTARQRDPGAPVVANVQVVGDNVRVRVLAETIPSLPEVEAMTGEPDLADGYLTVTAGGGSALP